MVLELVMIVGVLLLPLPAVALGARGVPRRSGRFSRDEATDRAGLAAVVVVRLLALLLVLVLSAVTLVAAIGALIQDLEMPSLVAVFFVLDLLLATLIVLTFGRRGPRRARRPAHPAGR